MTRTRSASANTNTIDQSANKAQPKSKDNLLKPSIQPTEQTPTTTPTKPSSRPIRRACFRTARHGARTLTRRRNDFERMVTHHISTLRDLPSAPHLPWSSLPESSSESTSQQNPQNLLTPASAHEALLEDDNGFQQFRVMLRKLRLIANKLDNQSQTQEQSQDGKDTIEQDQDTLHALAEVLATQKFLSHDDERISLLTNCCLAEILRISAPDPPISQHKLNDICIAFVEQITVMASPKDQMHLYRFALLEQLATVKSFVLFCDDHDIVADIFAAFYATARPHQTNKVREHMCDILVSLVDETETIKKSMLDALLAPLVPSIRYNDSAVRLAELVLVACQQIIQVPLCSMLNASLRQMYHHQTEKATVTRGGNSRVKSPRANPRTERIDENQDLSEHHQHISDLLVSINRVVPDVLVFVLPNLDSHITSEEDAVRNACAKLLARLFTSRKDIIDSYPSLFADYLHLHADRNADTRAIVAESLGGLIIAHPRKNDMLDAILKDRIMDKDDHVRVMAAKSIGVAGLNASDDSLQALSDRIRDKKHLVQKEALNQLSKLYRTSTNIEYDSQSASPTQDMEAIIATVQDSQYEVTDTPKSTPKRARRSSIKAALAYDRLSWFPKDLMNSYAALRGNGDGETTLNIEEIVAFDIPDVKSNEQNPKESSVTKITSFLSLLSDSSFRNFCVLVRDRQRTWQILRSLCQYRLKPRTASSPTALNEQSPSKLHTFSKRTPDGKSRRPSDQLTTRRLQSLSKSLAFQIQRRGCNLPDVEDLCHSFASTVDLKVFNNFLKLMNPEHETVNYNELAQDITARLGSTSAVGKFVKSYLLPVCHADIFTPAYFSFASNMVMNLMKASSRIDDNDNSFSEGHINKDETAVRVGMLRFLYACSYSERTLRERSEDVSRLFCTDFAIGTLDAEFALCGLRIVSRSPKEDASKLWTSECQEAVERLFASAKLENVSQETLLAKWGCRALINSYDNGANDECLAGSLTDVAKRLTSRLDNVSTSVESIILPLMALGQLAKYAPEQFKPCALECFDFCRALLNGTYNPKIKQNHPELVGKAESKLANNEKDLVTTWAVNVSNVMGDDKSALADLVTNHNHRCLLALVRGAVKLMVYSLSCLESCHDEFTSILDLLLRLSNEKDGDVFEISPLKSIASDEASEEESTAADESSDNLKALSRLATSRGILYITRHAKFLRHVPPYILPLAALRAQDPNSLVRLVYAKRVTISILRKRLPLRWASSLLMMAVDPVQENLAQVKQWLTYIFRHRRRLYESARRTGQGATLQLLPESIVPDFIWILSHMLDIEVDQDAGYPESQRCTELLLDRLLESSEHARVIGEFLESISLARDTLEAKQAKPGPCTERMWELGQMAVAVLKQKQAGKKWNLSERPGKISLPKDMFFVGNRREETSGVAPVSLLDVARKLDREEKLGSARKDMDVKGITIRTPQKHIVEPGENAVTESQTPSVIRQSDSPKPKKSGAKDVLSSSSGSKRKRRSRITEIEAVDDAGTTESSADTKKEKVIKAQGRSNVASNHTKQKAEQDDDQVDESPKKRVKVVNEKDVKHKQKETKSAVDEEIVTNSTAENLSDKENTEATKFPLLGSKKRSVASPMVTSPVKSFKSTDTMTKKINGAAEKPSSEHSTAANVNESPRRGLRRRGKKRTSDESKGNKEINEVKNMGDGEETESKLKIRRSPRGTKISTTKKEHETENKTKSKPSSKVSSPVVIRRSARHKKI